MAKFRIPDHIRKKVGPFSSRSQTIGYQIAKHNIPSVWSETKGEGVIVAILDTGCDQNHEDLIDSFSGGINLAAINDIKSLRGKINATRNNSLKKQLQSQLDRLMLDFADRDNHGCVDPDALIHTNYCGVERIETLYNRIEVPEIEHGTGLLVKDIRHLGIKTYALGVAGRECTVATIPYLHKTRVEENVVVVKLTGGITYKLTPWHPVSILVHKHHDVFEVKKVRADQLRTGNRMLYGSGNEAGHLVSDQYRCYGSEYRQCLTCGHIPSIYRARNVRCQCHQCGKSQWIKKRKEYLVNEDLAYICGLVLTDGHIVNNKNKRIEISSSTPEILSNALKVCERLGFSGRIDTQKGRVDRLLVNSKDMVCLLLNLGLKDKDQTYSQGMPEFVGKSPKAVIDSFIAGVIDGDGCISKNNIGNRVTGVSHSFAFAFSALLNSIGIHCGVQKYKNKWKGVENVDLPILNCTFSAVPFAIADKIVHPVRKARAMVLPNKTQRIATRIVSVTKEPYVGWFYDLTVDAPSHTYIANGHFVSNTHVSGIITANNNELGIVGVAPEAKVLTIKVLGDDGSGSFDAIIAGIDEAIARKADVINMSLGSPSGNEKLRLAIKRAYDRNIPIVCAAGNAGVTRLDFPACYPETISVGALDPKNIKASFSQMGPNLDFVAPGVDILSTIPGNGYMCMSGTSQATPWVTGIIALMLSKHKKDQGDTPINNVEDVRNHLRKVAIDIDAVGKDDKTGFGLIDVKNLFSQFSAKNISVEDRLTMMEQRILTIEKHLFPN